MGDHRCVPSGTVWHVRGLYAKGVAAPGELDLIAQIRRTATARGGALRLGIGDDCAVLRPPAGHDVLVTTDFTLEGKHFRRDWHPAQSAGHRCLARGLSDLAAMGARPMAAFLSLALPGNLRKTAAGRRWIDGFLAGLLTLAERTRTPLGGGDTATAPGGQVLADIVLLGSAPRGTELRRSGARPGDILYVTGALGGSAAELLALSRSPMKFRKAAVEAGGGAAHPHLFPQPRLRVGERLRKAGMATAAIDLSDGLSTDLRHLCAASGVGAIVDASALPPHALLGDAEPDVALAHMLHGGEDYELLFTARPEMQVPRTMSAVAITRIGEVTRAPEILLHQGSTTVPLLAGGWEHAL